VLTSKISAKPSDVIEGRLRLPGLPFAHGLGRDIQPFGEIPLTQPLLFPFVVDSLPNAFHCYLPPGRAYLAENRLARATPWRDNFKNQWFKEKLPSKEKPKEKINFFD
jgi:hypothetical protein